MAHEASPPPAPSSFETHGYYEEFTDAKTHRFLGTRQMDYVPLGRRVGAAGQITIRLTAPLTLVAGGFKPRSNRVAKGTRVNCRIYPVSGRYKWRHPHEA